MAELQIIEGGAEGGDIAPRTEIETRTPNLPGFRGGTYEQHVDAARMLMGNIQQNVWALAAVCASLESQHGKVKEFAEDIGTTKRHVRQMAATYRAWQKRKSISSLSFTHHTIATQSKSPKKALDKAAANDWSTAQLRAYVRDEKKPKVEVVSEGRDIEMVECPCCGGGQIEAGLAARLSEFMGRMND